MTVFTVTVRDQIMIAHSLHGAAFGPSQRLHGATFVVDLSLHGPALNVDGVLVDIARAAGQLRRILDDFDRRNLDDAPAFVTRNSTAEAVAQVIAERVTVAAAAGLLGPEAEGLGAVTVTVHESPTAWASYRRDLP